MIDATAIPIVLSLLAAGVTIAGTTWSVARILAKFEVRVIQVMAVHELEDAKRFTEVFLKIDSEGEIIRREFGETAQAIRQKVSDVELWSRDNYVQTPIFNRSIDEIKGLVGSIFKELKERSPRGKH